MFKAKKAREYTEKVINSEYKIPLRTRLRYYKSLSEMRGFINSYIQIAIDEGKYFMLYHLAEYYDIYPYKQLLKSYYQKRGYQVEFTPDKNIKISW